MLADTFFLVLYFQARHAAAKRARPCLTLSLPVPMARVEPGNTKEGSITVPLTSRLTCLESAV